MLPMAQARGCSGDARRTRPRYRLTGLPAPTNVQGCVLVAVQHQPTGRADRGTHRQAVRSPLPTAAASGQHPTPVLAGVGGQAPRSPDARRTLPWRQGWSATLPSRQRCCAWPGGGSGPACGPANPPDRSRRTAAAARARSCGGSRAAAAGHPDVSGPADARPCGDACCPAAGARRAAGRSRAAGPPCGTAEECRQVPRRRC